MVLLAPILTEYKEFYVATLLIGGLIAVIEIMLNLPQYSGLIVAVVIFILVAIRSEIG